MKKNYIKKERISNIATAKTTVKETKITWKDWLKSGLEFGAGLVISTWLINTGFDVAEKTGKQFGDFLNKVNK